MSDRGQEKATIHEVAEHAGVSIATVSRVVNGSDNVADTTREKVLTSAQQLHFRPNRTAKTLAQGATRTIAVAVPTFTTPFHNELLKGVRDQLEGLEADLLLCDLKWEAPGRSLGTFLDRGAMDGLLVAGLAGHNDIGRELERLGCPVVVLGSHHEEVDTFNWDDAEGARLATTHLTDAGHTRIGMITTHHESPVRRARVRGYKTALRSAGLEPREEWIVTGQTEKHAGFSEEAGYEAMQRLLADGRSPVAAVFASSDVQAIGAWQALRHEGLEVPSDVAIIGYDDIKVSRFIGLSSVSQNMHEIGERATELLLDRLNGQTTSAPLSEQVIPALVERASTRV